MAAAADAVLARGSPREAQMRAWAALRVDFSVRVESESEQHSIEPGQRAPYAGLERQAKSVQHKQLGDTRVTEAAVFRAMLRKNWRLKTRGLIKCCSGACLH